MDYAGQIPQMKVVCQVSPFTISSIYHTKMGIRNWLGCIGGNLSSKFGEGGAVIVKVARLRFFLVCFMAFDSNRSIDIYVILYSLVVVSSSCDG